MRISGIFAGVAVALAAASAGAYTDTELLEVAQNPEIVPYAEKVRDELRRGGYACDSVSRMNAFPQGGSSMLVVIHCSGGQKYEALWEGTSVRVKQLP